MLNCELGNFTKHINLCANLDKIGDNLRPACLRRGRQVLPSGLQQKKESGHYDRIPFKYISSSKTVYCLLLTV